MRAAADENQSRRQNPSRGQLHHPVLPVSPYSTFQAGAFSLSGPALPGGKFHWEIRRSLGRIAARLLQIRGGVIELLQARTSHAGEDFHPLV